VRAAAAARTTRWRCSSPARAPTSTAAGSSATWPGCSSPGGRARPGFELVARRRYREWTRRNATLLSSGPEDAEPWGDALVLVLTTVVSEAGHEVAVCEDEEAAARLAGDVLELIGRIGRPRNDPGAERG
jgi:hypothetical protein